MRESSYAVRGFLTVRGPSLRVPLSGSLTVRADPDSGLFTGDLALDRTAVTRTVLGVRLFTAAVEITAESPVAGRVDPQHGLLAAVSVSAVITEARIGRRPLISGGTCRTAAHAVVPLSAGPGFSLERGGRLAGRYHRPPFTGCGRLTPLVNLVAAGPGNSVVIDLIPAR